MPLKVLTAEQLYTCVSIATWRPYDKILASVPSSGARRAMTNRAAFVNSFRAPRTGPTEYLAGIPQALKLLNGRLVDDATDLERSDILAALEAPFMTDRDRVETLFLATLSRPPSPEIGQKFEAYVAAHPETGAKRRGAGQYLVGLVEQCGVCGQPLKGGRKRRASRQLAPIRKRGVPCRKSIVEVFSPDPAF